MSKITRVDEKMNFQDLSLGQRGTMVYIVQKILNTIGYRLDEDGIFSQKMEKMVKEFQSKRDNLVVDGIVGYQTMKEMDETSNTI
jgi:peptidoglycan hydrolase-like protein with peptidoglycan-binding domain